MTAKSDALAAVCSRLANGKLDEAASLLRRDYPFAPEPITRSQYGPLESTRIFVRDGFIDRFTGERLVYPPVLRVLSFLLPEEFPFHPDWKAELTHPAYWELGAAVDHVVPMQHGGTDEEANWATTSMAHHAARMGRTLDELGWTLLPPGDVDEWDGMLRWFLDYAEAHPETLAYASVRQWHRAASRLMAAR